MTEQFFIEILVKLFENAGYEIRREVMVGRRAGRCDLILAKDSKKYVLEVQGFMEKTIYSYRLLEHSISMLMSFISKDDMTPIWATYSIVDKSLRAEIMKRNPSLIILDIQNLLAIIPDNTSLRSDLIAYLPFAINDVNFVSPAPELGLSSYCEHSDTIMSLVEELKRCSEGRKFARKYETICSELLKRLFDDQLVLWKEQTTSNND